MSGFGASPWGSGPWGGATAPFDLLSAYAHTAQSIRLTFSSPPRAEGDTLAIDGLTRASYTLTSTGAHPAPTIPKILKVRAIDAVTLELVLAGELDGAATRYRVDVAAVMQNASGHVIGIRTRSFDGVTTPRTAVGSGGSDALAYPDLVDFASVAGAWQATPEGDYALSSGEVTLHKLILRRLTTPRGAFVRLTTYGAGLAQSATAKRATILALEGEAKRQVLREPEIKDCATKVTLYQGRGVLYVEVSYTLQSGVTGSVSVPVDLTSFAKAA